MKPPNASLDKVVKIGTCEAGMCDSQAVAEISLDTLRFDPVTLEARAVPKQVKVCMRHKSWYFKYQGEMLDRINPERKKRVMAGNENSGRKSVWETPRALLDDFEAFLANQQPHIESQLVNVKKLKESRKHIKNPKATDFEYVIEEQERLTQHQPVTIVQFAAWKKVHRTTIVTGYSTGDFQEVYEGIMAICEAYSERRLYDGDRNAAGIIFAMKNSYGWVDKTETELSGSIDTPLSEEAKKVLAKASRAGGDKGFSDAATGS